MRKSYLAVRAKGHSSFVQDQCMFRKEEKGHLGVGWTDGNEVGKGESLGGKGSFLLLMPWSLDFIQKVLENLLNFLNKGCDQVCVLGHRWYVRK